jgi:hypothetical protein
MRSWHGVAVHADQDYGTDIMGREGHASKSGADPDGTRAELMELHAIGKPCCSPFTAADPQD